MARPTSTLIDALRSTAARLRSGSRYRWTHMGACNCGHLAQTITRRSREEIHRLAVEKAGDWGEHAVEYCATSGYPIDHILSEMLAAGLELRDVEHLERLSDPAVLRRFPVADRALSHRDRADVVRYLDAWADLLEERLADEAPKRDTVERSGVRRIPRPRPAPATEDDADEPLRRTG
jgi:hypothetical protein